MFKKLFGKKANSFEEKSALDENKLIPVFMPSHASGLEDMVYKAFIKDKEEPLLMTTVGYLEADNLRQLRPKELLGLNYDNIFQQMEVSLSLRKNDMEVINYDFGKLIHLSGDYFTSEKVLIKQEMEVLHKELNSQTILVSIASRGNIIAIAKKKDNNLINNFLQIHKKSYLDVVNPNDQLSKGILEVKSGSVTNYIPMDNLLNI
jgi:hypothetical protein